MAHKVLGQLACAATTPETVYAVPSGKSAVVSTISVCNRGGTTVNYRLAVRPAAATLGNLHYVVYDATLPATSSDFLTLGITLAATDVVTFYCSAATASVSVFGDES